MEKVELYYSQSHKSESIKTILHVFLIWYSLPVTLLHVCIITNDNKKQICVVETFNEASTVQCCS